MALSIFEYGQRCDGSFPPTELIGPQAMGRVDAATIAAGTPGFTLMQRAGRALAAVARDGWEGGPVTVLAGPGNNGGDGLVAGRILRDWGYEVSVQLLGDPSALKGDAAQALAYWDGSVEPLVEPADDHRGLVIDALFGAGLTRPLSGVAARWAARSPDLRVVAADLPSGVDGATGEVDGPAMVATATVCFGRAKPGHVLLPGRDHVGRLQIAPIGLMSEAIDDAADGAALNHPNAWRHLLPRPWPAAHKYDFGHAAILGGPAPGRGAALLAAEAAAACHTGLVTLAFPEEAAAVYAPKTRAILFKPLHGTVDVAPLLADRRITAWAYGPAAGVGGGTRKRVQELAAAGRSLVLDADALTSFVDAPTALFDVLHDRVVLTPHAGEAARLFPADVAAGVGKLEMARAMARRSGAIVLLKGYDTVIATPDGSARIQPFSDPRLAMAGSGDVLTGLIVGLMAQGLPPFEAASAAVWLHVAAAQQCPSLPVADRLIDSVPEARTALSAG